ncbi:MAG: hypothetical protein ACJAVG_000713 [Rickettsiales bacterium]|jgi:hypothetical protein
MDPRLREDGKVGNRGWQSGEFILWITAFTKVTKQ